MYWRRMTAVVTVLGALLPLLLAIPAQAVGPEDRGAYVKYYEVGPGDTLDGIAERLLGSAQRSGEVLALNQGRLQPDGERLTDPLVLNPGWLLILPWDAAGTDVHYGPLPTGGASGTGTPPEPGCLPGVAAGTQAGRGQPDDWAGQALSLPAAWRVTRGGGVMVAVVDSGVAGDVAELAGRVLPGADVTKGTSQGDVDCLGTGTAIASLIAARRVEGRPLTGLAPEATVFPLRVTDGPTADPRDAATAIEVGVSAGARVIMVGAAVPTNAAPVVDAIDLAIAHDVVVVVAADPSVDEPTGLGPAPGLLRVAAVDRGGRLSAAWGPGSADLVAPGVAVAALTPGGAIVPVTGAPYAAAFVAGTAALVRAAAPSLTAAEVAQLMLATAASAGSWRYVDPPAALTAAAQRSPAAVAPDQAADGELLSLLWAGILVTLAVLAGILLARWLARRRHDPYLSYVDEQPTIPSTVDYQAAEATVELPSHPLGLDALRQAPTAAVDGQPVPAPEGSAGPDPADAIGPSAATPALPRAPLRSPGAP